MSETGVPFLLPALDPLEGQEDMHPSLVYAQFHKLIEALVYNLKTTSLLMKYM